MVKLRHKTYKFRLYPNIEQEILMTKIIESSRFVYNHMLNA
ncbi:helix-turn-helix domain-containing protein [Vagococcus humatus]